MTEQDIWRWQGQMFIYASYLYYVEDYSILSDEEFDQHCKFLLDHYDKLLPEFTSRVDREHLQAGTGFDLTYTKEDIIAAHAWRERVENYRANSTTRR